MTIDPIRFPLAARAADPITKDRDAFSRWCTSMQYTGKSPALILAKQVPTR